MQAQQYPAAHLVHSDYYDDLPHPSSTSQFIVNPYIAASDAAPSLTSGFSRGSSFTYPNQDHPYSFDLGELNSRLCTTGLVDHIPDATGLGFAGNSTSSNQFCGPEDDPASQPPPWDWQGSPNIVIVAPAPVYAAPHAPTYLGVKPASFHPSPSAIRPQTTQVPTPATMAIHLNPHVRSDEEPTQDGYEEIPSESGSLVVDVSAAVMRQIDRPEEPVVAAQGQAAPGTHSREKKHACTMCHKRFDRPSTLRKHLLVHTGEKAFVCETCGRRFGVASNLNRHVKRCVLKLMTTSSPTQNSSSDSPMSAVDSPETSHSSSTMPASTFSSDGATSAPVPSSLVKRTRAKAQASVRFSPTVTVNRGKSKPSVTKRRRRAPSPSQWIPETLQDFELQSAESLRSTAAPLPPVRRNPPKEERDSWDENVTHCPYHPDGWRGMLPGPGFAAGFGLGGRDLSNLNLGGRGGFMLGRVAVF